MSQLRSIVDRTYEAFNARDFDAYRDLLDEHVELVMSGIAVRGRAAATEFVAVRARARPGLRIEPQRVFVETGDTLVTEVRVIDTARADSAEKPSTVEASACGLYRVAGGRIVEWRVYLDSAAEEMASAALTAVAAEQSALRRVAELVARQAPPEHVFALVTEELSSLVDVSTVSTARFEPNGTATVMATRGTAEDRYPPGTNVRLEGGSTIDQVFRTGRPAHVADYEQVGGEIGIVLRQLGSRSGTAGPIVVDGRLWGAMAVASQRSLPPETEHRVAQFAELVSTAISNLESRTKVERLAAEQAALRRVAEVVARQAPAEQVFALVTEELSQLLDIDLVRTVRFEADGTLTVLATRGLPGGRLGPGTNHPIPSGTVVEQVLRTGRPARVDDYAQVSGPIGDVLHQEGVRCGAGGPIVVGGRVWGAMAVSSTAPTLPVGIEDAVAQFAELVSTAISNLESRAEVERLAAEQSALRRVATLVARQHSPEDLFAALAGEIGVLLGVDASAILRYEADSTATVVAGWSDGAITIPLGRRFPLEGENLAGEVHGTGKPRRKENYAAAAGPIAATVRELGIRGAVASPIVVEGATWGVIAVLSRKPEPLPLDTEARLAEFSRHAGIAVANAKSRSELAASKARARELAVEQAALRRVATLVAQGASPDEVFSAVAREVAGVIEIPVVGVNRYEADGTRTIWRSPARPTP